MKGNLQHGGHVRRLPLQFLSKEAHGVLGFFLHHQPHAIGIGDIGLVAVTRLRCVVESTRLRDPPLAGQESRLSKLTDHLSLLGGQALERSGDAQDRETQGVENRGALPMLDGKPVQQCLGHLELSRARQEDRLMVAHDSCQFFVSAQPEGARLDKMLPGRSKLSHPEFAQTEHGPSLPVAAFECDVAAEGRGCRRILIAVIVQRADVPPALRPSRSDLDELFVEGDGFRDLIRFPRFVGLRLERLEIGCRRLGYSSRCVDRFLPTPRQGAQTGERSAQRSRKDDQRNGTQNAHGLGGPAASCFFPEAASSLISLFPEPGCCSCCSRRSFSAIAFSRSPSVFIRFL